jgi:hypothetical protein
MPNSKLISEIADNYQLNYGFMALNATRRNAKMFAGVDFDDGISELKAVHDELIRRGVKAILTKEEYDAGVATYGVPPAFDKT